jgi:hypothetical protein
MPKKSLDDISLRKGKSRFRYQSQALLVSSLQFKVRLSTFNYFSGSASVHSTNTSGGTSNQ